VFSRAAVRDQVFGWVDQAVAVQHSVVRDQVAGAAAGDGGPAAVVASLEGTYLAAVSGAGAVVGGAASIPGVGTGLAVGLSVAETAGFLNATALFAFAVAEAAGAPVVDLPRRRALFLAALLGDDVIALTGGGAEGFGGRLSDLPDDEVDALNRTAERWLLTRYGPRQGMLVLGRLAPFGIGAAVGAAGNAVTAKGVIGRLRSAYLPVTSPGSAVAPDGVTA
jgi:hypothetical protein